MKPRLQLLAKNTSVRGQRKFSKSYHIAAPRGYSSLPRIRLSVVSESFTSLWARLKTMFSVALVAVLLLLVCNLGSPLCRTFIFCLEPVRPLFCYPLIVEPGSIRGDVWKKMLPRPGATAPCQRPAMVGGSPRGCVTFPWRRPGMR
jgi:hypothetical protein